AEPATDGTFPSTSIENQLSGGTGVVAWSTTISGAGLNRALSHAVASTSETGAVDCAAARTACTFAANAGIAPASIEVSRVCTACGITGGTNVCATNVACTCGATSSGRIG